MTSQNGSLLVLHCMPMAMLYTPCQTVHIQFRTRLQNVIIKISKYYNRRNLKLIAEKSEAILFTGKRPLL